MTEDEMREAAAVAHRNAHGAAYGRDAMPLEWWRKQASWKHEIAATNAALRIALPWAREQALREAAAHCIALGPILNTQDCAGRVLALIPSRPSQDPHQ